MEEIAVNAKLTEQVMNAKVNTKTFHLWVSSGGKGGAEALNFPSWSEMTPKQVEACVIACRDALAGKGPDVTVSAANGEVAGADENLQQMIRAIARAFEGGDG